MKHHCTAILSGAAVVTSFIGVGIGATAGAAPSHASPTQGVSAPATMKTLIRLQTVAKPATLRTAIGTVNGKTEKILVWCS
jgi:hypothetical protein